MRRLSSASPWLVSSVLASALLSACNIGEGFADLGDSLLDPDAALLDRPGRQLVSGKYTGLVIDGSKEKGGYVLALRTDTPEQRLAIVPFLEGEGCELKGALAFERLSSRVDVALSGLVAVQTAGDIGGFGTVRFVGFDCQTRMDDLADATLPRFEFPVGVPRGLLTLTKEKNLYLANAETRKLELVASGVSSARVTDGRLWTLEAGQLVVRNDALEKLATLGDAIVSYAVTGGAEPEVILADVDGVHTWSKDANKKTLTADGCAALALDTKAIAYFSPCAERRLVIELPGEEVGSDQARVKLLGPTNVLGSTSIVVQYDQGERGQLTRFLFVTAADPAAARGELLVAELEPKAPAELELATRTLGDDITLRSGIIYSGWDGTRGDISQLAYKDGRVTELTPVAQGVAQLPGGNPFSARGALVRFDNGLGDLVRLEDAAGVIEETLVAKGVPIQYQPLDDAGTHSAFVANVKDGSGQVLLYDAPDSQIIAKSGRPDTLRFLEEPRAVAFLATGNAGFDLHAYLLDSGLDLTIHESVTEYRVVPWPSPGILYSVGSGDDAGLWFSKAR